ncbi:MAG TPA: glycosyltransferase [Stellaceae bacterium]|nr:glycosyltransferase [Stellaceae bacterium]
MSAPRPRVLMICAHPPSVDPRIAWEAGSASREFDVTVLGFASSDGTMPPPTEPSPYRIVRLPYAPRSPISYFRWFASVVSPIEKAALVVAGAVVLPIFALAKAILLFLRLLLGDGRATRLIPENLRRIFYIVGNLRFQFAPATVSFWSYIRSMPEKPDVVHCNDLDTLLVGVLARRHYGTRVVFDAHEFFPVSDSLCRPLDIAFFTAIEKRLIVQADAVVTVNPLLAEAMRKVYALPCVHSVPNAEPWVEREVGTTTVSPLDALAPGRVKFLFQGRFAAERGIREMIEGFAHVDHRKAALFLRGPDNAWRQEAEALTTKLGLLGHSVYFLEPVGEDELVGAAAQADVGIIPYKPAALNERLACPNKLSQYLHAGLLVMTNDLPYVRSVLNEAEAGLWYRSEDLTTFAAAVQRIVDDPEFLRRGKENARRFAQKQFNWQRFAPTLHRLYRGAEPRAQEPSDELVLSSAPGSLREH